MMEENARLSIYTDGACSGNPGVGGWAAILIYKNHEKAISGGVDETTNNRMELQSAIEGLKMLKKPCEVDLYSDSAYLIDAFNKNWLNNWQRNAWQTAGKSPVKNIDLWQELLELTKMHTVKWIKVKGHSDNRLNNACDALARGEIAEIQKKRNLGVD